MQDLLKQIDAKRQQLGELSPLDKQTRNSLGEWLRVELTYSSNAIEGNTLTRIETAEIMDKGVNAVVSHKPLRDLMEAENHRKALDYVFEVSQQKSRHQHITERDILAIHKLILMSINTDWAGRYREGEVFVAGTDVKFSSAQAVPYLMEAFFEWLQNTRGIHPVLVATEAHTRLVSIHPFVDANGRTARLLMNLILLLNDYPLTSIPKKKRMAYLDAVNQAQTTGNMQKINEIVGKGLLHSLDTYLSVVEGKPVFKPKTDKPQKFLKIGELAKQTGETIHTLRYWTKLELLPIASKTKGGYLLYSTDAAKTVKQVRRLQSKKRLTLAEIKKQFQTRQVS